MTAQNAPASPDSQSKAEPVAGTQSPGGNPGTDNPPRGIAIILVTLLLFSCSDAAAKALGHTMSPLQIVFMRYLQFAVAIVVVGLIARGPTVFRSRNPGWQLVRGLGVYGSALFFTMALQRLPMAEAIAINFVSPIFITLLAVLMLGEKVGPRRWASLAIGVLGMLIIVRPGTSAFRMDAIFPILAASSWAFGMIGTRKTSFSDNLWTALIYSAVSGLAVSSVLVLFVWQTPTPQDLALSAFNGSFSTVAQLFLIFAYRYTPASVLAPFSYSQLIWSVIFGYAFFAEIPDRWTVTGAIIIVGSGLYTVHRERVVARERRQRILSGS